MKLFRSLALVASLVIAAPYNPAAQAESPPVRVGILGLDNYQGLAYAELFNSPIIGLTGSPAQIDAVKKQFGIYAQPEPDGHGGMHMINHTATVLLFDRAGKFSGTISSDEPDSDATAKLKRLAGA